MADVPEAVAPLTLRNEILLTQYEIRLRRMKYRLRGMKYCLRQCV